MIPKDFDGIGKADIDALVTNKVAEGRALDYKQQLPGGTDDEKKEFLVDVSSFANAAGGDLIYGVSEERDDNGKATGLPEKAEGIAGINADAEIRRLEESVRSGIAPRIPSVRLKRVDGFTQGPVILMRIPKSWAAPHMVIAWTAPTDRIPWDVVLTAFPMDRDLLLLPDVLSESITDMTDAAFRPVFDSMWQAFGLPRCPNYSSDGKWDPVRARNRR